MSSMIKLNQYRASPNTTKNSNEFSDETDQLQSHINVLKVSKYTLEENLLSCSHRAIISQVVENEIKVLIIRLAELQ